MKKIIFVVFILSAAFQACTFKSAVPANSVITDTVSYSKTIAHLDSIKCNSCHTYQGTGNGDFTTYAGIQAKTVGGTQSSLYARVVTLKDMPTPGSGYTLTDAERNEYAAWIQQGAKNN
jgi:uncharacterized membrane protein